MSRLLWTPSADQIARANLTAFARFVTETRGVETASYGELWRWSVEDLDGFWSAVWEYFAVDASPGYEQVLGSREMPGAEWFPGVRLNWAEHIFRGKDDGTVAIRFASETRPLTSWTWGDLRRATVALDAGLRRAGVRAGDRVAAYLPNTPEAVVALLACAAIGATFTSCSPDFGARSVIDRVAQVEPVVFLTVDGYRYAGRDHDRMDVVAGILEELPSVRHTVLLPYLDPAPDLGRLPGAVLWSEFVGPDDGELEFERVPFAHPLFVLYSSGTTGLPKAIVHGHGGILLEQLKMGFLHLDAQPEDRFFWFTTTGWMMWNWLVGCLLTPASIVLYDGSPGHPDMGALWDLAEQAGITSLGVSASYIGACMKAGVEPRAGRDLSALRAVGSTGSPLSRDGFRWVYDRLGPDLWLFLPCGGTDICTAFITGVPTLPVYEGEMQAMALGARVESWDGEGRSVVGEVGELVVVEPLPSMPVSFWNDPDGSRLRRRISHITLASGDTGTGSRSPSEAPRSSTAGPTRRSTAAACGWGLARSTVPSSRSPRSSTRSSSTCRDPGPRVGCRCSSCSDPVRR